MTNNHDRPSHASEETTSAEPTTTNGSRPNDAARDIDEEASAKLVEQEDVSPELEQLAKRLLAASTPTNYEGELGQDKALEDPDVDISLHPSRKIPVAGELWSISGEVYNRSNRPVWIVDTTSVLTLAPEMYGLASRVGSQGAFFPTIKSRPTDEVVRIDPGAKYFIVWKLDPASTTEATGTRKSIIKRVYHAVRNYAFFNPGVFRVSATIHVWSTQPRFDEGRVQNIGDSFAKSVAEEINMESSPWVLITYIQHISHT